MPLIIWLCRLAFAVLQPCLKNIWNNVCVVKANIAFITLKPLLARIQIQKTMRFVHRLFLAMATLWLVGCAKELSTETGGNPPPDPSSCQIDRILLYDNNTIEDSLEVVYNGSNISRYVSLGTPGLIYDFTYTAGRISTSAIKFAGIALLQADFEYNTSGLPVKITIKEDFLQTGTLSTIQVFELTYNGAQLASHKVFGNGSGANLDLVAEFTYNWTGNNITSYLQKLYSQTDVMEVTVEIQTNNDTNQLKANNPQIFFTDPVFSIGGIGEFWPVLLNQNTVVRMTIVQGDAVQLAYENNSLGKLETMSVDGEKVQGFRYNCQ